MSNIPHQSEIRRCFIVGKLLATFHARSVVLADAAGTAHGVDLGGSRERDEATLAWVTCDCPVCVSCSAILVSTSKISGAHLVGHPGLTVDVAAGLTPGLLPFRERTGCDLGRGQPVR
jgi:hypothetical protein